MRDYKDIKSFRTKLGFKIWVLSLNEKREVFITCSEYAKFVGLHQSNITRRCLKLRKVFYSTYESKDSQIDSDFYIYAPINNNIGGLQMQNCINVATMINWLIKDKPEIFDKFVEDCSSYWIDSLLPD